MKQIVTVAKIVGESSQTVANAFRRWSDARVGDGDDPTLVEPSQWPASCRVEMTQLAEGILANRGQPPLVFCNQHVDLWSMGDVFADSYPQDGNRPYTVQSDHALCLWCYPLPDGNALVQHVCRRLRRTSLAAEAKWYLHVLLEAVSAWGGVADRAVLVVLRQVVGALVEDREVEEAFRSVPPWLEVHDRL